MKKNSILFMISILFIFTSCQETKVERKAKKIFPVEVEFLKNHERVRQIEYFGIISTKIMNNSFLTSGRVKSIFIHPNQYVNKGDKLMQLESKGHTMAINAAKNQEKQAQSAYLEANKYYQNLKNAFNSGGIPEINVEKAQFDSDIKFQDWEQSKINIKAKQEALKQTILWAQTSGIVSEIIPKVGDIISAGTETLIIQGNRFFVETDISQKDLDQIKKGTKVTIEVKGEILSGKVHHIASLPNLQTFRHNVKIVFNKTIKHIPLSIGLTVKLFFHINKATGIWIPLKFVSNNGRDFVKLVENGRLTQKEVKIIDFSGDEVRVDGLKEDDQLITKGAANIKEGYSLRITNKNIQ